MVGEYLRALVSKLALNEAEQSLHALQPLQIGVGGKGPVIQAAILCVKSWLEHLGPDEVILKVDVANTYNTISRAACFTGVKQFCPDMGHVGTLVPRWRPASLPRRSGHQVHHWRAAGRSAGTSTIFCGSARCH